MTPTRECSHPLTVKYGKTETGIQRVKCRFCGVLGQLNRNGSLRRGYRKGARYPEHIKNEARELRKARLSFPRITRILNQEHGLSINHSSVMRWIDSEN